MSETEYKVIKFVQELLDDERKSGVNITLEMIEQNISRVILMNPKWGRDLDHAAVAEELIRRFSTWIGESAVLHSDEGHHVWLDAPRKKNWRYWQRYREFLERSWNNDSVEELDKSTDNILGRLEDPLRDGVWDRRGLVVGHVQSGKTANYTGLICKAADAGYKIIIVLAGMYNNLRSQTQIRLDEGFLGFRSDAEGEGFDPVGVGEIDSDLSIRPNFATNRKERGDFNTRAAAHLGITPEQRPWLFVVKKNKTVLERLFKWICDHVADSRDAATGRKLVTKLPLLVVDDESDNASVDTGEQFFDNDGSPVPDYEPKAINRMIRRILHAFTRSAYVGYTATPFANIFIHEKGCTLSEGPDLFPAAFIMSLEAPSNHVGPGLLFGSRDDHGKGLSVIRDVKGADLWLPAAHKKDYIPSFPGEDGLPPSLCDAILSFFMALAVRKCRGQGNRHSSMLIHVTKFNAVQACIRKQVEDYVRRAKQRLLRNMDSAAIHQRIHELWFDNSEGFIHINKEMMHLPKEFGISPLPSFDEMMRALLEEIQNVQVKTINGSAKDILDYEDYKGKGLKVIVVGGDKLSRGLTLEGLTISYFLRASKMYDTLMQMGRWFGYRTGYLDVCRLYIPAELTRWFRHIAEASKELHDEFRLAVECGMTPREYGLRVQSHSTLMVTSRVKMRNARELKLSFSGQLVQTVAMYRDAEKLSHNYNALKDLLRPLGTPDEKSPVIRNRNGSRNQWDGYLWNNVPSEGVVEFLGRYLSHPEAYRVNTTLMAEFITKMNGCGALTSWTVALIGSSTAENSQDLGFSALSIGLLKRYGNPEISDRYSIGTLISPRDESIDLDDKAWNAALDLSRSIWENSRGSSRRSSPPQEPSGPGIRQIKGLGSPEAGVPPHPDRGLLLLYLLDPVHARMDHGIPVVALGLSFPSNNHDVKVSYKVNNIYWEQEYGA